MNVKSYVLAGAIALTWTANSPPNAEENLQRGDDSEVRDDELG